MSVLNQSGEEQVECPLCMEPLEVDDLNFYPCTCGYQICRFCWHRIRTDENGLCPACRKAYSENPADFTPLSKEQVAQLKAEKRARDQQRKARLSESRKHLATVRVVQKNLVFVVGLPVRLADAEVLRRHEYFGKFGKIHKVVINQSTSYAGSQGPSASAYVTYYRSEDALRAIQSVNNITLDGRLIKSSLGTTKYCSHFMKNQPCPKPDCMYLHDLGDTEASFTKEEMHQGKHQEYEKRLHEALAAQVQNKSLTNSSNQSGQNASIQKEAWPSLSRNGSPPNVGKERKNSNSESKQSTNQSSKESNNSIINNNNNNNLNQLNNKNTSETTSSGGLQTSKIEKNTKSKNSNKTNNKQQNNENITNNLKNSQKTTSTDKETDSGSKLITAALKSTTNNDTEVFSTKKTPVTNSEPIAQEINHEPQQPQSNHKQLSKENFELEMSEDRSTDRSTNSSPVQLLQHSTQTFSNKINNLYEDNTSFFSPNTFQKLISDENCTLLPPEMSPSNVNISTANSSSFETNTNSSSNILNDSLPNINSTEDWEAAFGFTKSLHQKTNSNLIKYTNGSNHSQDDSCNSSISTTSSIGPSSVGGVLAPSAVGFDSVVNQFNSVVSLHNQPPQLNSLPSSENRNSFYNSNIINDGLDVGTLLPPNFSSSDLRNTGVYNHLNLPQQLVSNNTLHDLNNLSMKSQSGNHLLNGLDQHMYKFFADFHKNSLKEPTTTPQSDFINNQFDHSNVFPNATTNLVDIGRHNYLNSQLTTDHLIGNSTQQQQQHNILQQQRIMEKHINDQQQILLNLKNQQQQNGHHQHNSLLTAGAITNQPNFLNHGGYQQNFLLQNQINLVQNQHNLINGDQHNISLIGNQQNIAQQFIGNTLANQHSNLLNGSTVTTASGTNNQINRQQTNSTVAAAVAAVGIQNLIGQAAVNFNQFNSNGQQQQASSAQHLINSTNQQQPVSQQRNVEDELGFDPFHETQKALAELMESEQMLNSQQQQQLQRTTRLPPPGFSHMNSFGIGLPRPHGSKILPFMSLGQTNNTSNSLHQNNLNSQSSNGWPVPNSITNLGQNSGLGVCNDWTTLDPAIVTSSRHFPLVANMGAAIRDQFSSNMPQLSSGTGASTAGGVSALRGLDFTTTALQQPTNNFQTQQLPVIVSSNSNVGSQATQSLFQQNSGAGGTAAQYLTNGFNNSQSTASVVTIAPNWADFQNQIPLPPGFRQNNQPQGKTQEC